MLKKLNFLPFILLCLFSLPGLCQEEDQLLEELESDRKEQTEQAVKLDKAREDFQNSTFDAFAELKNIGHETVTAASLLDERVVKILQKMFQESPLRKVSKEEVRHAIFDKVRGTFMEGVLARNPKVVDAMVAVLQDEKAMPQMMGIFLKQDSLKIYFFIWLGIMIGGALAKRFLFPPHWKKSFFTRLCFSLLLTLTTMTIFYQMFYDELNPTVKILTEHWRRRNL